MKAWAEKFYKSEQWRKCRKAYIHMRHGICERCCDKPGKIVHHKIYLNPGNIDDPIVTMNFNNLELLCQDCHNTEHQSRYGTTRSGLTFDIDGQLIKSIGYKEEGEV